MNSQVVPEVQLQAIHTLGTCLIVIIVCMGIIGTLFQLSYQLKKPTWWWDAITLGVTMVAILSFMRIIFDPAVARVDVFGGPSIFVMVGSLLALALFYMRVVRKDLYGVIEVSVALATLWVVGKDYSPDRLAASLIGFVGSVYVMIRGMTNIVEARGLVVKRRW